MRVKVILNPYANRWNALKRKPEVELALQKAGIDFDIISSERPGHLIELAAQAVKEGFEYIIAAGGDGTINEVVNGIQQSAGNQQSITLGILPLGSANDLVVNIGLSKDLNTAAEVISRGKVKNLDLCKVNQRYFVNNAAIGLEPSITVIQESIKRVSGVPRYLLAAVKGVMRNPSWTMHLQWEGGEYKGPITLVTVGNAPVTGGLFYMTPHADPFDGKLTFVYGYLPTRFQIFKLLPHTMRPGKGSYVEHPAIHEINTTWLKVKSDQPTPAHSDGEVFSKALFEVEYTIHPGKQPILIS
jgi:diacylglycerol kinase (ATP)